MVQTFLKLGEKSKRITIFVTHEIYMPFKFQCQTWCFRKPSYSHLLTCCQCLPLWHHKYVYGPGASTVYYLVLYISVLTPWLRENYTRKTGDMLGDETSKTQEKLLQNLWHRAYFGATVSTISSLLILITNKVPLYILASKCLDTKGIQHISSLAFWGEEGTYPGT